MIDSQKDLNSRIIDCVTQRHRTDQVVKLEWFACRRLLEDFLVSTLIMCEFAVVSSSPALFFAAQIGFGQAISPWPHFLRGSSRLGRPNIISARGKMRLQTGCRQSHTSRLVQVSEQEAYLPSPVRQHSCNCSQQAPSHPLPGDKWQNTDDILSAICRIPLLLLLTQ